MFQNENIPRKPEPQTKPITKIGEYTNIQMFLYYPKSKKNPNGDPVAKQGDRQMIMARKNAIVMFGKDGEKYYRKSDLFIHHYQPTEITEAHAPLKKQAMLFMRGNKPFENEVIINKLVYHFSPLKGTSKKDIERIGNGVIIPKKTKPDLTDNLSKLLMDALSDIVFVNDSSIWKVTDMTKIYSLVPGVFIDIIGL